MILHKHMFWSETTRKRQFEFTWKLKHNKLPGSCYVAALPEPESGNLLELLSVEEAQKADRRRELTVVGLAQDKTEAIEVARTIVDTVCQETGGLDVKGYFSSGF